MGKNKNVKNMSALARAAGINRNTIEQRLLRGWSLRKSLTTPVRVSRSVSALAQSLGLNARTVYSRIQKGMSLEKALTTPLRALSSSPLTRLRRIYRAKCQIKAAALLNIDKVSQGKAEKILKHYRTLGLISRDDGQTEVARKAIAAGLKPATARYRISRGWSEKRALSTPTIKPGKLSSKARAAGLSPTTVRYRIYRGWSMKRALSTPPTR